MTDEQLSQAKTKILHIPTVLGAVVPAYNVPGVSGELKFTPEALAGIFTGQNHNLERSCDCQGEPRRQPAQPDDHRDPSLGRQRYHLHLHRLSLQGQFGVAERAGEGNFREVARRIGRQRQRRRCRNDSPDAGWNRLHRTDLRGSEQDRLRQRQECFRSVRESFAGQRDGGGRFRQEHASGFPRIHHQRAGERCLSRSPASPGC